MRLALGGRERALPLRFRSRFNVPLRELPFMLKPMMPSNTAWSRDCGTLIGLTTMCHPLQCVYEFGDMRLQRADGLGQVQMLLRLDETYQRPEQAALGFAQLSLRMRACAPCSWEGGDGQRGGGQSFAPQGWPSQQRAPLIVGRTGAGPNCRAHVLTPHGGLPSSERQDDALRALGETDPACEPLAAALLLLNGGTALPSELEAARDGDDDETDAADRLQSAPQLLDADGLPAGDGCWSVELLLLGGPATPHQDALVDLFRSTRGGRGTVLAGEMQARFAVMLAPDLILVATCRAHLDSRINDLGPVLRALRCGVFFGAASVDQASAELITPHASDFCLFAVGAEEVRERIQRHQQALLNNRDRWGAALELDAESASARVVCRVSRCATIGAAILPSILCLGSPFDHGGCLREVQPARVEPP